MSRFTFLSGPRAGNAFEVGEKRTVIGRDEECDIPIDDERVSRKHVALVARDGGIVAIDLGSSNGTFVNDDLVTERTLQEGDILLIGYSRIRYGEPVPSREDAEATVVLQPGDADEGEAPSAQERDAAPADQTVMPPGGNATIALGAAASSVADDQAWDLPTAPDTAGWRHAFPADPGQLPEIGAWVRRFADAERLPSETGRGLDLAAREIAANIVRCAPEAEAGEIRIVCGREAGRVSVEIAHRGDPFDPARKPELAREDAAGESAFLAHSLMDSVEYRREGDANIARLTVLIETDS